MISKELLQQVIKNLTVKEIIYTNKIDNNIYYSIEEIDILQAINIYELAHKLKMWANKQGYKKVYSGIYESTDQGSLYICIIDSKEGKYNLDFWADTEVEAIIKACEWILKETNGN